METSLELGPDCLWVVTPGGTGTDRRAFYPWDASELAGDHAEEAWLPAALDHLSSIEAAGAQGE